MEVSRPNTQHNLSLDGLRGIAALNVTIVHFIGAFFPSLLHNNFPEVFPENSRPDFWFSFFQFPFFSIFYNGHFAVLIFFVLSGYVLTIPYFRGQAELLKNRLWARYLRLNIPIFVSILVSYLIYFLDLYTNRQAAVLTQSNWLSLYFPDGIGLSQALSEAFYRSIMYGEFTFNPPLWSLCIEFVGSLYLMAYYLCKPQKMTGLTLLIVFIFFYLVGRESSLYFVAMFLGAQINTLKLNRKQVYFCLILGLYFGAFQYKSVWFSLLPALEWGDFKIYNQATFYNTLGALFLIAAIVNGWGKRFLESPIPQFLGKISFSLYLYHFLILCSLTCSLYLNLPQNSMYLTLNFLIYLVVCFVVSIGATRSIDRFSIWFSHQFARSLFAAPPSITASGSQVGH